MTTPLHHETDFSAFHPLDAEQVYYAFRFLAGHSPATRGKNYLGDTDTDIPWSTVASYVNERRRGVEPVCIDGLKRAIPAMRRLLQADEPTAKYSFWCQMFPDSWFTFMNYGYFDTDSRTHYTPVEKLWEFSARLYEQTARVELRGLRVLEVGSGRGGGAALLARTREPASYVGLDATNSNVAFCRDSHRLPSLSFEHGRATELPFDAGAFDVLINIESAFYYRPLDAFAAEAARVVRSRGAVCLATFGSLEHLEQVKHAFGRAGFMTAEEVDISQNVQEALRRIDGGKAVLRQTVTLRDPRMYARSFEDIYTVPSLVDGTYAYRRYVFRNNGLRGVRAGYAA